MSLKTFMIGSISHENKSDWVITPRTDNIFLDAVTGIINYICEVQTVTIMCDFRYS